MARRAFADGLRAGLVAGVATLGLMYLAAALTGLRPLPELLQQPLLAVMPGVVFGFLIDTLQHAGKVLEEIGLAVLMVAVLGLLGGAAGVLRERRPLPHIGLRAGGAGFLLVGLVALPISGEGWLGLGDSLTVPLLWALLMAAYGLALEATWPKPQPALDPGRRRLLVQIPVGLTLAGLGLVALLKAPGWVSAIGSAPESGLRGPVPEITPLENFYLVSKNFNDPVVASAGWALRVGGLVDAPFKIGYEALRALPPTTQLMTLSCISNNVGGDLISTGSFTGVPLRDLIAQARPRPAATAINFKARDGFTESIPLSAVMDSPDVIVAYDLGGAPLTSRHGHPARVLIPGRYGMKQPKWLDEIELAASEVGGYWENQGWDHQATVKTFSRFDSPADGAVIGERAAGIPLAGVAFAGRRGIRAVEWSADGGATWTPAQLRPPLSQLTWVLWTATWMPAREGSYTLRVRARDSSGELQTDRAAASFPSGSSGWHTVRVSVSR